jgi:hypothetical protein
LFVAHQPRRFYFHFIVSVGLCAANTLNLIAVFRFKSHEGIFGRDVTETEERTSSQKFKKLLSMSHTYLMALELLFYVGLEVTIGGWIVRTAHQRDQTKGLTSRLFATRSPIFWNTGAEALLLATLRPAFGEVCHTHIANREISLTVISDAHRFGGRQDHSHTTEQKGKADDNESGYRLLTVGM